MSSVGSIFNGIVMVLVLLLGPAMIVFGQYLVNIDEELKQTGTQTTGIIIDFDDVNKASEREITVQFMSEDGSYHRTWADVDHDAHPVVGDAVTVVYRGVDPSHATVLGYDSDGAWFRGAGTLVTFLFVVIGMVVVISVLLGRRKRKKRVAAEMAPTK